VRHEELDLPRLRPRRTIVIHYPVRFTWDPLDGELDFERFGPVRRDAFAGAGERGGPSLLALWEMPEIKPGALLLRRGHPGQGKSRGR